MKDKDDSELLYTIKVNIEEIYAKATQIYHEAKKKSANVQTIQRQSTGRYDKLQGTDQEMCTALNQKVITSILGGLNGRKVELSEYMEKTQKPESMKKELGWIFEELKAEKVNPKLASLMKIQQENEGTPPVKYETLFDFVNSVSVDKLLNDATISYQQLESLNYTLGINFAFLIGSIERPIEELTLASGMISSSYRILQDHYKKISEHLSLVETYFIGHVKVSRLLTTIREQHERIRKIFSFRVLSKGSMQSLQPPLDKEFKVDVENLALTSNNENLFSIDKMLGEIKTSEDIISQEYEYYEEYARKKIKAYQSLMNVPQKAKTELQAIEEKFKEFENSWSDTTQKFAEIESLIHWYKQFKKSYHGLFVELQRRIKTENMIEQMVDKYRKKLNDKFDEEVRQRNKFNTSAIKYLPPAFHALLTMNPIKYEIFPTQNISPLAGLSVLDEELFGGVNLESAPTSTTSSPATSEKIVKARTTTI